MGAYNAALPVIEAFSKGLRDREAVENRKLREEQLKAQLEFEKKKFEEQQKLNQEKFNLEQSVARITNFARMAELVASGKAKPETVTTPTGVVPGAPMQYGTMVSGGQPAVGPSRLEMPPAVESPVIGNAPQETFQRQQMLAGVDVTGAASPDEMIARQVRAELDKAKAINQEITQPNIKLQNEFRASESEKARANQFDIAKLNAEVRANYQKEMLNFRKQDLAARTEYQKERLANDRARLALAAQKISQAKETMDYSGLMGDIKTGALTQEQIVRMDPKNRAFYFQKAKESGLRILTEAQVNQVRDLATLSNFHKRAKALAEKIKNTPLSDLSGLSEIRQEQQLLSATLEPLAKTMGYKGVITDTEQKRLMNLIPEYVKYNKSTRNEQSVNAIKSILNEMVKKAVPEDQWKAPSLMMQRQDLLEMYGVIEPVKEHTIGGQ